MLCPENFFICFEKFLYVRYTDQKFFGDGGGGKVAKKKFEAEKNFQVKCEILIL